MLPAPIPANEKERLAALARLKILDTEVEEQFDRITRVAAHLFKVPISTVTLVDSNREWFKSCFGLDKREGERAISFCGHAMLAPDIFIIPDATKDPRFADNPMVIGKPFIRFYAGVALSSADGYRIGTFCIKDHQPRDLTGEEIIDLKALAAWAEIELNSHELSRALETRKEFEKKLELQDVILTNLSEGVYLIQEKTGKIIYANARFEKMFGYEPGELVGKDVSVVNASNGETPEEIARRIEGALRENKEWRGEIKSLKKDGTVFWCYASVSTFNHSEYGLIWIAVHTDITESKKAEELLKKHTKELELINKVTIGRELKMIELKKEIEKLKNR